LFITFEFERQKSWQFVYLSWFHVKCAVEMYAAKLR